MALPSSGQITINQIHVEAGGSSGSEATINDGDIRSLIGKDSAVQNAFNEYYGSASTSPTANYIGRLTTTNDGFPSSPNAGYITLSSDYINNTYYPKTKLVVICTQLAGTATPLNSTCSIQGQFGNTSVQSMTLAVRQNTPHQTAIYYLETNASGQTLVLGQGGTGRSSLDVYELYDYGSTTPYTTDTASNSNSNSQTITVNSNYNGVTIGCGMSSFGGTNTTTVSNADAVQQIQLESATAHFSWKDEGTPSGNRSYAASTSGASSTGVDLCTASWK